MNRISRELAAARPPALHQMPRSGGGPRDGGDDALDLFSRSRRTHLVGAEHDSGGRSENGRFDGVAAGSGRMGRSPMDDLLSSEMGKHDYDWLLTPPGTPVISSAQISVRQRPVGTPRSSSNVRSVSVTKASRLSVSQAENGPPSRPARSSSVTRPSISTAPSSSLSNKNNRITLNTSTASVTSRPTTPGNRSTISARTSAPTSRVVPSRSSTPAKIRPVPTSNGDKTRPAHGSRPSTPTGRTHVSATSNSTASTLPRSISRPSTPTRRPPTAPSTVALPSVGTRPPSAGRASVTTNRTLGHASRPCSPAPKGRTPVQPIIPPDFPLDAPPNLRTKLPERAISAGRTRPGMALTVRSNTNTEPPVPVTNRRNPSPNVTRGRLSENTPKSRAQHNGHDIVPPVVHKPVISELTCRKPTKPSSSSESTGFGRTISKKSIDMALKHMDIRQNLGGIRSTSLFPQSIRSAIPRGRAVRLSDPVVPTSDSGSVMNESVNGDCSGFLSENGDSTTKSPDRDSVARATEPDIYGSYRYDVMLLKEDSKTTNWLHGVEDQCLDLEHRFEPLPEPFCTL